MRITAVSRVLNEDDIIEAFVRHTLAHVDNLLILDNGSTDRTLEILAALKAEGAALTVIQNRSPTFQELNFNTLLYHTAKFSFQPDWVFHLDADEFLDTRAADLRTTLEAIPPESQAITLALYNYFARDLDVTDPLVPRRMVLRDVADRQVRKCMIRGTIADRVMVADGNHSASAGGASVPSEFVPTLPLAHYPVRHPLQNLAKTVTVRLKVLAAGGGPGLVAQRANHYTPLLDALCRDPAEVFGDQVRMTNMLPSIELAHDPIHYAGGDLRYTTPTDPAMKAIRALILLAQEIAASHGALLDADPAAHARMEAAALTPALLFP